MEILAPGTTTARVFLQRIRTPKLILEAGIGGCSARWRGISIGGNRVPMPFISMYCDKIAAFRGAERRVRDGKKDVRVYTINMRRSDERVEYRNIRLLAEKLGFEIPERALNNSEYEYVLLHHVPDIVVQL